MASQQWWRDETVVQRWLCDLIAGELSALRPGAELPGLPWPGGLDIGPRGLGCDSLELLELASSLNAAVHMHRTGIEDHLLARRTVADWRAIVVASLEQFSEELSFASSGTTGTPNRSTHALNELVREIAELAEQLPGRTRVLCAVPAHHIYGFLFTVLLPVHRGISTVDVRQWSPARVARELRAGDVLIGHPDFWRALTRAVPSVPAHVMGVTSTAPCPPVVADAVIARGVERLLEVYGSSETSGIGWRTATDQPYALLSFWRRESTGARLVRRSVAGADHVQHPPDQLAWSTERHFLVGARHDGVVQVGGINVQPSAVAKRLTEHCGVAAAAVRAMQPFEGNRLKAFVVPADSAVDHGRLSAELTRWCTEHLTVPEQPKAFSFGPQLPVGALGKLADWPLPPGWRDGPRTTAAC